MITTYKRVTERTTSIATQKNTKIYLGNPHGEENPTKIPIYRCIKSTRQDPRQVRLLLVDISLSLLCATHK